MTSTLESSQIETKMVQITNSVTTTAVLEQILGVAIVALMLTILELLSIVYVVFPSIRENLLERVSSQDSAVTKSLKPLIQTLAERERENINKANEYIKLVGWGFAVLILLFCILLAFLISNEYRLQGQPTPPGLFKSIAFWAFLTIIGIGHFQGFACIVDTESRFCSKNSFAVVSTEWTQNENIAQIALSTGLCDGVSDETVRGKNLGELVILMAQNILDSVKDKK
jgi:tetrahydromethanopterin S-methyltransferase subunit B